MGYQRILVFITVGLLILISTPKAESIDHSINDNYNNAEPGLPNHNQAEPHKIPLYILYTLSRPYLFTINSGL